MLKLTLFVMCMAFLAVAGGLVPVGMALGALGIGLGALALTITLLQMLTR